jgi:hypothetical protein
MSPNSLTKWHISASMPKPKCDNTIPTNNTQVIPNEIEPNLILPKSSPIAIVRPKMRTECATELDVKRFINQSIPNYFNLKPFYLITVAKVVLYIELFKFFINKKGLLLSRQSIM